MELAGEIIIVIGAVFMLFGVIGIFKYRHFYPRVLIVSKIDTVGALTIIIGLAIRHGWSFFSLRVLLLLAIMLVVNPMVTQVLAGSAYTSGYQLGDTAEDDDDDDLGDEDTVDSEEKVGDDDTVNPEEKAD